MKYDAPIALKEGVLNSMAHGLGHVLKTYNESYLHDEILEIVGRHYVEVKTMLVILRSKQSIDKSDESS